MKVEVEADGTLLLKEVVKMDFKSKIGNCFVEDGQWRMSSLIKEKLGQWRKDDKKHPIVEERNEMLE
jgi:hypothetical protein